MNKNNKQAAKSLFSYPKVIPPPRPTFHWSKKWPTFSRHQFLPCLRKKGLCSLYPPLCPPVQILFSLLTVLRVNKVIVFCNCSNKCAFVISILVECSVHFYIVPSYSCLQGYSPTDCFTYISYQGANILRDLLGNVKLADFGVAKRLQVTTHKSENSCNFVGICFLWLCLCTYFA